MGELIRHILVPLDGSKMAESVLPVVEALASCLHARITLLHIIEQRPPQTVHGEPHLSNPAEAEAYLRALAGTMGPDLQVEQHVHDTQENNVALSLAAHAAELEAGMIALCMHGRSDWRRVLMGSIAQQVLRQVTVPTLLVRPGINVPARLDTLTVPLDGLPSAESALPVASEIAQACHARVRLVRVVPTITTLGGDAAATARVAPFTTAATLDAQEGEAGKYLQAIAAGLTSQGVATTIEVRRGETEKILLGASGPQGTQPAGMIVIATHARTGLDAIWTGSIAAGLVGKAAQPLLLVRISAVRGDDPG